MDSAGVFSTAEGGYSPLWDLTWDRISAFLPHLQQELFKSHPPPPAGENIEHSFWPVFKGLNFRGEQDLDIPR